MQRNYATELPKEKNLQREWQKIRAFLIDKKTGEKMMEFSEKLADAAKKLRGNLSAMSSEKEALKIFAEDIEMAAGRTPAKIAYPYPLKVTPMPSSGTSVYQHKSALKGVLSRVWSFLWNK